MLGNFVSADFKTISKESALKMLESIHPLQRSINENRVSAYARSIETGNYTSLNGQTIVITESGVLLDGQHRLSAIARTGVSLEMMVFTVRDEYAEEVYRTIDSGRSRDMKDSYGTSNEQNALSRSMYCIENTNVAAKSAFCNKISTKELVSDQEAYSYFEDNKDDIIESCKIARRIRKEIGRGSIKAYSLAYLLAKRLYRDEAIFFFEELTKNCSNSEYVTATRNAISKRYLDKSSKTPNPYEIFGIVSCGFLYFKDQSKIPKCFNKQDRYAQIIVSLYRKEYGVNENYGDEKC